MSLRPVSPRCMRPTLILIATLFTAAIALANPESHVGDVTIRSDGTRVIVLVDTTLDATVANDGVVDQAFVIQFAEAVPTPIDVHLTNALVVHTPESLRVTTSEQRYEFKLGDASAVGIAHREGKMTWRESLGDAKCQSGGPGATACSLGSPAGGCEITCVSGYYACADMRDGVADCQCVKDE